MAPIIRTGRSEKCGMAVCTETLAERGEPFLSKVCKSLRLYMASYPKGSVVH